jgi:predicted component of type VI protein secretion system
MIEPNGVQRALPLTPRGLTIGRSADNSLVVNYADVSRHHAHISFDGHYCYVTDLESGNGTYLGNIQLVPHEPMEWRPGIPLKVGSVLVQLAQEYGTSELDQLQSDQAGPRDRQNTETFVGQGLASEDQQRGGRWLWLGLGLGLVVLCACAGLGAAGYFFYGT